MYRARTKEDARSGSVKPRHYKEAEKDGHDVSCPYKGEKSFLGCGWGVLPAFVPVTQGGEEKDGGHAG